MPEPTPDLIPTTGFADVQGRCPACHGKSLFLGDGGYVTCSRIDCPEPDAASTLLETPAPASHGPRPEAGTDGDPAPLQIPLDAARSLHAALGSLLPAPAPEPGLREQYAAAIYSHRYGTQPTGETWNGARDDYLRTADAVLNVRDAELQQLRQELAQWYAADSADAAAGSYAGRAEAAEQQRDQLRDLLREVLDTFARVTAPPNPNALGYQGASIAPADFERWEAALDQPQEQP